MSASLMTHLNNNYNNNNNNDDDDDDDVFIEENLEKKC